jgi:hypothetical protein
MPLEEGKTYKCPHGTAERTILSIVNGVVTYRMKGLLTFMPARATIEQFQRWLDGVPSESQLLPAEGMAPETLGEAMTIISKWQDEGEDAQDLAIALFELYRRGLPYFVSDTIRARNEQ